MHSIYTTPGFIIDSRPYSEAGKVIAIFTRDLGLVMATAQGIRLEKSKLRYHTQEYSFGTFSLVRGKEFWRLTNADEYMEKITEACTEASLPYGSEASVEIIPRLALLLRRLLHGEQTHLELFDCVKSGADFLERSPELNSEQLKTLESLMVFKMLELLGYIGKNSVFEGQEQGQGSNAIIDLSLGLLDRLAIKRFIMNQHINKALRESHL